MHSSNLPVLQSNEPFSEHGIYFLFIYKESLIQVNELLYRLFQVVLNSSNTLEKDVIYDFLKPYLGNGLLTGPGKSKDLVFRFGAIPLNE